MDIPDINNRIKKLVDIYTDGSVKRFAENVSVSQQTLNRLFNIDKRTNKYPVATTEILRAVSCKYPNISTYWLLTGNGDMYVDTSQLPSSGNLSGGIPLIPAEAVSRALSGDDSAINEFAHNMYAIPIFNGAEFLVQVKGDSMQPKYYRGDMVACKRLSLDSFLQWNKAYVIDSRQGILIKRIRQGRDSDHILLISDNKEYDPFEISIHEINSLAIILGVIREE